MLWWFAMLVLIQALMSSTNNAEDYDWEGSFTIGMDQLAPATAAGLFSPGGGDNKPEVDEAAGGDGPAGGEGGEWPAGAEASTGGQVNTEESSSRPALAAVAEGVTPPPGPSAEQDTRGDERFMFWRDAARAEGGSRRMFGGTRVESKAEQARAVALIDHRGFVHCSGAALTPEWILTASHCLTPSVTSLRTAADSMMMVALIYIYKHPQYKVAQRAVAGGLEVTSLVHDVGLAQAERGLALSTLPALADTLADMERHDLRLLFGSSLTVYGFGRVESSEKGGELFAIRTRLAQCANPAWAPCVCGSGERGVCAGDSGGPVFYNNTQVAVTSLGPMSCSMADESMSVFTALRPYVPLIRATVPAPSPAPSPSPLRSRPAAAATPGEWLRVRVKGPRSEFIARALNTSPALVLLLAALAIIKLI